MTRIFVFSSTTPFLNSHILVVHAIISIKIAIFRQRVLKKRIFMKSGIERTFSSANIMIYSFLWFFRILTYQLAKFLDPFINIFQYQILKSFFVNSIFRFSSLFLSFQFTINVFHNKLFCFNSNIYVPELEGTKVVITEIIYEDHIDVNLQIFPASNMIIGIVSYYGVVMFLGFTPSCIPVKSTFYIIFVIYCFSA